MIWEVAGGMENSPQLVHGGRKPDKYKRWGKALGSYLAPSENIHERKPDVRNMERPLCFRIEWTSVKY